MNEVSAMTLPRPQAMGRKLLGALLLVGVASAPSLSDAAPSRAPRDDYSTDLSKWVSVEGPTGERWKIFRNDRRNRWAVTLEGGKPRVSKVPGVIRSPAPPAPIREGVEALLTSECPRGAGTCALRVKDGWVVGLDGGEFAGGLWWLSPEGERRYRISGAQVRFILPAKGGPLAFGGLQNTGYVYRLVTGGDGRWEAKAFADDLGEVPDIALVEDDGSILVTSHGQVLRIGPGGRKQVLLQTHGVTFDPTSLVVTAGGEILIGGRHCVTRIVKDPAGYRAEYLLPSRDADTAP